MNDPLSNIYTHLFCKFSLFKGIIQTYIYAQLKPFKNWMQLSMKLLWCSSLLLFLRPKVSLRIQSECGKIADQNNSEYGQSLRSATE